MRRAIAAAVAAGLLAGAQARAENVEATAESTSDESPEVPTHVEDIAWHGLSALDSNVLEDAILTAEPGWLDRMLFWRSKPIFREEALERDMQRIADAYAAEGYFEASARYQLTWNDVHDRVRIDVFVTEGEPVHLDVWELEVAEDARLSSDERAELRGLLPRPGVIFGSRLYRETREAVLRRFGDLGHPAAELAGGAEVDLAKHVAHVAWKAEPGPIVHLGAIEVTGLDRVQEKIVRRELRFREGDVYSGSSLSESERRVYDLGLFRSVAIQAKRPDRGSEAAAGTPAEAPESKQGPEPEADVVWPVEVRVTERDPRSFRISVGYGTEDLFRTRASWIHRNFFGEARRLEVRGEYSALVAGGSVELQQAHLFDSDVRGWIRGTAFREDEPAYEANRVISGIGVERLFAQHWTVSVEPIVEWGRVEDPQVDDPTDPEGPREAFLDSVRLGLRRSSVDNDVDPQRGTRLDLTLEPSARALGSDLNYLEATVEGRAYVPVYWKTVIAVRLKLATFEPLGGDGRGDVPLFKRLYSGGSMSVRGFDYHRLGPRDADGDPLGGLSLAEGSVELRFPIWRAVSGFWSHLGGVVFFDTGEVSKQPHDWRGDDFFYSVGGGLRLGTPVGPLRLDIGHVLNPSDFEEDFRVHFSVGHTF